MNKEIYSNGNDDVVENFANNKILLYRYFNLNRIFLNTRSWTEKIGCEMIEGLHEAIPRGEETNFKVAEHRLIRLWIVNIHWGVI